MEHPLCKICRERHSLRVPCRIKSGPVTRDRPFGEYPAERVVPLDKLGLMSARDLHERAKAALGDQRSSFDTVVGERITSPALIERVEKAIEAAPKNRSNAPRSGTEDRAGPMTEGERDRIYDGAMSRLVTLTPERMELMAKDMSTPGAVVRVPKMEPDWSGCPHCAARREKVAKAVAKHRAKRKGVE